MTELTVELETVIKQRDELKTALGDLVNKLMEIAEHPDYATVFQVAAIHGFPYFGPTFKKEIEAAQSLLTDTTSLK